MQEKPLGTGDAVRCARAALDGLRRRRARPQRRRPGAAGRDDRRARRDASRGRRGGDRALLRAGGRRRLRTDRPRRRRPARADRRGGDASAEELALGEVNSGIYVFGAEKLWPALERLTPHNAQGELYVTDTLGLLVARRRARAPSSCADDPLEAEGVNTRAELAAAAAALRDRINERAHARRRDDRRPRLDVDRRRRRDRAGRRRPSVHRHPRRGADRERRRDRPVRLDPRRCTEIGEGAKIGTFVELKNAAVGARTKIPHLSYIGDAEIGDGHEHRRRQHHRELQARARAQPKERTKIGSNVRTGVDNTFVAPVEIGDDAWIAPGAVITENVPPGSLAGFAPRQVTKEGWVYEKHGNPDGD